MNSSDAGGMDRLSAHLDRGWYLAQNGEAEAAATSAREALSLDPESPEAHNLLGFALTLLGELDEALSLYEKAIALDEDLLEPLLNAAELCIFPLEDFEAALDYCRRALPLTETDEELTDTLLLQFDAYLGLENLKGAQAVLDKLPAGPSGNPEHHLLMGRAFFELKDYERAEQHLRDGERRDPENADAPYYLGMILDEKGDTRGATLALLRCRSLDEKSERPPWSLSEEAFAELFERALRGLAHHLRTIIDPNEVYLAQLPGVEAIAEGADPRAPALLDMLDGPTPHVRIFVYQRNIERLAGSADRIENELRSALERELATATFDDALIEPKSKQELN